MKREVFNHLIDVYLEKEKELLLNKGQEYTRKSPDVLANFKRGAQGRKNLSPVDVWSVYFIKHIDSIITYIDNGYVVYSDEPIQNRIRDARNYLLLLAAFVEEAEALIIDAKEQGFTEDKIQEFVRKGLEKINE